jgi:hypothetical protein
MATTKTESSIKFGVIDVIADPKTGLPVECGRFGSSWKAEERLQDIVDRHEAGNISDEQALNKALSLAKTYPFCLEIHTFIGVRLWDMGLIDRATRVYELAFQLAEAAIPNDFKGQINYYELDNRPFLRLAHGTLLGLVHKGDGEGALKLAKKILAWCPQDNLGVRFLLSKIELLAGNHEAALKDCLSQAPTSPSHWYQAALISFRKGDYCPPAPT